jgi:hypothetical protein
MKNFALIISTLIILLAILQVTPNEWNFFLIPALSLLHLLFSQWLITRRLERERILFLTAITIIMIPINYFIF